MIKAVHTHYRNHLPMQLFMGGLNPGNTDSLSADSAAEIRQHWQHVEAASAQPFNYAFFERSGFVYDTEPASRAVMTALRLDHGRGLDFLSHLQHAFYVADADITDEAVLVSLAAAFGFDPDRFHASLLDEETRRMTRLSFGYARHLKITGFPTLIAEDQTRHRHAVMTRGYQPLDPIRRSIDRWLDQSA